MIEGRIQYRSYDKDGVKHCTTDIIAENLEMLGRQGESESREPSGPAGIQEDDIPF